MNGCRYKRAVRFAVLFFALVFAPLVQAQTATGTILTSAGRSVAVIQAGPLVLAAGNKGFAVQYVTPVPLTDRAALHREALEVAREFLRRAPNLADAHPAGLLVMASNQAPWEGWFSMSASQSFNTPLEPAEVRALRDEIAGVTSGPTVTAAGWSAAAPGPVEPRWQPERGGPVNYLVFVEGIGRHSSGQGDLEVTCRWTQPDGKSVTLKGTTAIPAGLLPVGTIQLPIDKDTAPGEHRVDEVVVKDRVTGRSVSAPPSTFQLQ